MTKLFVSFEVQTPTPADIRQTYAGHAIVWLAGGKLSLPAVQKAICFAMNWELDKNFGTGRCLITGLTKLEELNDSGAKTSVEDLFYMQR